MRIILVRHGEPDYAHDSLTEKGWREARLLGERVAKWNVKDFYCSPYGRAKDTAKPSLELTGKDITVLPWVKEFDYATTDPITGRFHLSWDYTPEFWTSQDKNFTLDDWVNAEPMCQNREIADNYKNVCDELDKLLLKYGYKRDGKIYRTVGRKQENVIRTVGPDDTEEAMALTDESCQPTIVIFCHLGACCVLMSHLLNIPFMTLPHGLFLPPSSVNILTTEERWEDEASFRAQAIGDCTHLLMAGEPISSAGAYSKAFQK
ncbi:MAG: histidine phosphatase family protein [Lachnospiraceae bacterium]|nr:histidine phosphatase family protein [Lachnospiraceae bacterium]